MTDPAAADPGTYEQQLALVRSLIQPTSDTMRTISWSFGTGPVGLARSPLGHIEIFLSGPKLEAHSATVRENLEHQQWYRSDGEPLLANRLLLPLAGHFDQVAAFLSTELLRNGAATDLVRAFRQVEPTIELAIERLRLSDQAVLGLCGEMTLLLHLLRSDKGNASQLVESWTGHREVARDFQVGHVGIEVKTTTGTTSAHQVQGVHQVEPGHGVDGKEETAFLLVSIGLRWSTEGEGDTLPQLIDLILSELDAALGPSADAVKQKLLKRIEEYGTPSEIGYDHSTMSDRPAFGRRFQRTFVRCYDMADSAVRVLRTQDLDEASHIDPQSVRFRIRLPASVRADVNPVVGLAGAVAEVHRRK